MNKVNVAVNGLFLSVICIIAYYFLAANMAVVELNIATEENTFFRIYYKETASHWSQGKSSRVYIKPGQTKYSFRLTDLKKVDELRIDTSENTATVTVRSIVLNQSGFKAIKINSEEQFARLQATNGIAKFSYNDKGFTVVPATNDPFLIYSIPPLERDFMAGEEVLRVLLIIGIAFLLAGYGHLIFQKYRFVLCSGLVVVTLISVMAGVSRYNVHPDEFVHVKAASYFKDHNLPPVVGDPETLDTYSVYGTSRLHMGEIAYFFAGKFAQFLGPLHLQDYLALRFFNVCLFGLLCILAIKSLHFRILLIPLMLSPQIWYIFSYYNSEGYSLFITLLVSYQMVSEKSSWNRMLGGDKLRSTLLAIVGLGILLALLLLTKKNFYFYGLFLGLYFLWRLGFKKTLLNRANVVRIVSVVVVAFSVFGAVRLTDSYINDFEKEKKRFEAREKYASEMYKPSTPLEKKFPFLYMKKRGVKAMDLLRESRWGEKSFRTAFGGYGYTTVSASPNYYEMVRYSCIIILLSVIGIVVVRGGWQGSSLLAITLATGAGLVALAFYHSWTMDFQAQGRYFLPIVGMMAMCIFHLRRYFSNVVFAMLFSTLFGISLYSYIFVALAGIPKINQALG